MTKFSINTVVFTTGPFTGSICRESYGINHYTQRAKTFSKTRVLTGAFSPCLKILRKWFLTSFGQQPFKSIIYDKFLNGLAKMI